jgi:hypothetical protein
VLGVLGASLLLGLETDKVIEALGGGPLASPWQAAKLQRIAEGEFLGSVRAVASAQGPAPRPPGADDDRAAAPASRWLYLNGSERRDSHRW